MWILQSSIYFPLWFAPAKNIKNIEKLSLRKRWCSWVSSRIIQSRLFKRLSGASSPWASLIMLQLTPMVPWALATLVTCVTALQVVQIVLALPEVVAVGWGSKFTKSVWEIDHSWETLTHIFSLDLHDLQPTIRCVCWSSIPDWAILCLSRSQPNQILLLRFQSKISWAVGCVSGQCAERFVRHWRLSLHQLIRNHDLGPEEFMLDTARQQWLVTFRPVVESNCIWYTVENKSWCLLAKQSLTCCSSGFSSLA